MNTKNQLPSDIDYIVLFDNNTDTGEARFDLYVKTFWSMTMEMTKESNSRQSLFRL
ncbi:TPA: hypothetical protein ACM5EY_001305 [Escherichia coli]